MRKTLAVLAVAAATLALVPAGGAGSGEDESYDCAYLAVDDAGEAACRESGSRRSAERPPACRVEVEAVFWTASDWVRLGEALAAEASPCGEYWISIPPLAADKTRLRVLQDDVIRALGPQFHPVAEMTLGDATGWAAWVSRTGNSWFEAGVEFRRRMADAGYDLAAGETWLLNELDRSTRLDIAPYGRAQMHELLRGLYLGDSGMPAAPGIAEIGIAYSHQNLPDVAAYKAEMKAWLVDEAFWTDLGRYVRVLAKEVYPDTRTWGVPGSSRAERRRHLEEYQFHLLELARSGPPEAAAAREFLERAFLPLANGAYRARGGDPFGYTTGHGNTIVSAETMKHFVSEQVHAIRHYAGSHPQGAPAGRLGFSWQPCNRLSAAEPGCGPVNRPFAQMLDEISARIAQSIHFAYRQGGASPIGACAPPASPERWCDGEVPGAAFTDAWRAFETWE
jgi:hypothetical protein